MGGAAETNPIQQTGNAGWWALGTTQHALLQRQQLQGMLEQNMLNQLGAGLGQAGYVGVTTTMPPEFQGAIYQAGIPQAPVAPGLWQTSPEVIEAQKTAEALLLRHLNDEQKASWGKHKGFWVTAKSGRRYWLDGQRPRGISEDGPPQSFCIHGMDENGIPLPKGDQILAQKLLIETDEERFLKTANASKL